MGGDTPKRTQPDRDVALLDAAVPEEVRAVCRRLAEAGHQACTVGGAVRDALLGAPAGDWDVATSAHPSEVVALFERTVPTGIQHGTVTVLADRGARRRRHPIEVTTFRGEGEYTDARRPDSVTFGVALDEDLARRDFVVNAMAFDPVARVLHDPFRGRADLAARRLRAVGDAGERFREDGLRVMRAVRFVAVLGFSLDPDTEAAIPGALASLRKVSVERVRDELFKLLAGRFAVRGLDIARRARVLDTILPEVADRIDDARWRRLLARVDAAGQEPVIRLAVLLVELAAAAQAADAGRAADAIARRLRLSNTERVRVTRAVAHARAHGAAPGRAMTDAELRRMLAAIGRDGAPDVIALWEAEAVASGGAGEPVAENLASVAARARAILDRGDPLAARELAISGGDVMAALGLAPGPVVGQILARLLARVLDDPAQNSRDRLLAAAPEILRALAAPD